MGEYNRPFTDVELIRDMERRLRVLETAARVLPTNDVIPAVISSEVPGVISTEVPPLIPSNSSVVSTVPTILRPASYVSAVSSPTGISTIDGTTVSLPSVTATGSLLQIIWTWRWWNWDFPGGAASLYYASDVSTVLDMDGLPISGLAWQVISPPFADMGGGQPGYMIGVVETTPGSHTFQGRWNASSSGATSPVFQAAISDQSLVVTPLRFD